MNYFIMLDPEFMEHEYQIDEPIEIFDMSNANDVEFEEELPECKFLNFLIFSRGDNLIYYI